MALWLGDMMMLAQKIGQNAPKWRFCYENAQKVPFLSIFSQKILFEITQSKCIWVKIENVILENYFFAKNLISPLHLAYYFDSQNARRGCVDFVGELRFAVPRNPYLFDFGFVCSVTSYVAA